MGYEIRCRRCTRVLPVDVSLRDAAIAELEQHCQTCRPTLGRRLTSPSLWLSTLGLTPARALQLRRRWLVVLAVAFATRVALFYLARSWWSWTDVLTAVVMLWSFVSAQDHRSWVDGWAASLRAHSHSDGDYQTHHHQDR